MAGELHEFQMPQPIFTTVKGRNGLPIYSTHHTDLEMRTNVGAALKSTKASRATTRRSPRPAYSVSEGYSCGSKLCLLRTTRRAGPAQ